MPSHAALLRGVNVTGSNLIPMAGLRELFAKLGLGEAQTLLQSGNAVFDGGRKSAGQLEALLEGGIAKKFKLKIACMVRTAEELQVPGTGRNWNTLQKLLALCA